MRVSSSLAICRGLALVAPLLLAPAVGRAQALPLDGQGRAGFGQVVQADSLPAAVLYAHAKSWLLRRGYTLALADSAAHRLEAAHAFGVYDRGYVSRKLHGKVRYQLVVEAKDGRYRLQMKDFVFAYYQEDRTARPVPTGKTKPLEDPAAPGWQQLWETHRRDALLTVTSLAGELKTAMLAVPVAPPLAGSPTAADW